MMQRRIGAILLVLVLLPSCTTTKHRRPSTPPKPPPTAPAPPSPESSATDKPAPAGPTETKDPELVSDPVPYTGDVDTDIDAVFDLTEFDPRDATDRLEKIYEEIEAWGQDPDGPTVEQFNGVVERLARLQFQMDSLERLRQEGSCVLPPGVALRLRLLSYCIDHKRAGPDNNEPSNLAKFTVDDEWVEGILLQGAKEGKEERFIQDVIWDVREDRPLSELSDEKREFLSRAGIRSKYRKHLLFRELAEMALDKYGVRMSDLDRFNDRMSNLLNRKSAYEMGSDYRRAYTLPYRKNTGVRGVDPDRDAEWLYRPFRPAGLATAFDTELAVRTGGPIVVTEGNDGMRTTALFVGNPKTNTHSALFRPTRTLLWPDRKDVQRLAMEPYPRIYRDRDLLNDEAAEVRMLLTKCWEKVHEVFRDNEFLKDSVDIALSMPVPGFSMVGQIIAVYELSTGKDVLTGRPLNFYERAASVVSIAGGKYAGKVAYRWFKARRKHVLDPFVNQEVLRNVDRAFDVQMISKEIIKDLKIKVFMDEYVVFSKILMGAYE